MHEHPNVTHAVEGAAALAGLGAAGAVAPELLPSTLRGYVGGVTDSTLPRIMEPLEMREL